jgi:hypothetical protein
MRTRPGTCRNAPLPCGRGPHGSSYAKDGEGSAATSPQTNSLRGMRCPLSQGARAHIRRAAPAKSDWPSIPRDGTWLRRVTLRDSSPSARSGCARQKFFHLDGDAVAADDDGALGHRQVVGEDAGPRPARRNRVRRWRRGPAVALGGSASRSCPEPPRDRSRHFPALPRAPRAILRCRFGPMRYPLTTAWSSGG